MVKRLLFVFVVAGCSEGASVDANTADAVIDVPLAPQQRACLGLDIPAMRQPYDNCQSEPGGLINCSSDTVFCTRYWLHQSHPPVASCTISCGMDADCPNQGICLRTMTQRAVAGTLCFKPCSVDRDCPPRTACRRAGLNGDPRTVCVPYETCTGDGFVAADGG